MAEPRRVIGALRERVRCQQRPMVDDGFGNMVPGGEFETAFTVWAQYTMLRGGEAVQGARLEGRQPLIVTVRRSSLTRQIDTSWRLVDNLDPSRVFAVTAPPQDPSGSREWLDILVTEGAPS